MSTSAEPVDLGNDAFIGEVEAHETEHRMTFETEMDQFFARNCYTEKERGRVRAWPAYRLAADKNDTVEAQEVATRVLEKGLGILTE
jgi:hypothetical protein